MSGIAFIPDIKLLKDFLQFCLWMRTKLCTNLDIRVAIEKNLHAQDHHIDTPNGEDMKGFPYIRLVELQYVLNVSFNTRQYLKNVELVAS